MTVTQVDMASDVGDEIDMLSLSLWRMLVGKCWADMGGVVRL